MLSKKMYYFYVLVFSMYIIPDVKCQWNDNTPPMMFFDRKWVILEAEPVGTVIRQVTAEDKEGDPLTYGLELSEPTNIRLPFQIDNQTGVIYLNESLKGRAGEHMMIYVTATDGGIPAKYEVLVNIVGSTGSRSKSSANYSQTNPKVSSLPFLSVNSGQPPASIANNPQLGQNGIYQRKSRSEIHLSPVKVENEELDNQILNLSGKGMTSSLTEAEQTQSNTEEPNHVLQPVDQVVKLVPDSTVTLVPILSVCGIFVALGVMAFVFRKKICLERTKDSKEDVVRSLL